LDEGGAVGSLSAVLEVEFVVTDDQAVEVATPLESFGGIFLLVRQDLAIAWMTMLSDKVCARS